MYFVLLIHRAPDAYADTPDYPQVVERYARFTEQQRKAGRFVSSVRLFEPRKTVVVKKAGAGKPLSVTDGPFAETKELLAGLFVLDCKDRAEAEQLAAELPAAQDGGAVEVRPVFDLAGALGGADGRG